MYFFLKKHKFKIIITRDLKIFKKKKNWVKLGAYWIYNSKHDTKQIENTNFKKIKLKK
jgi:hypothetical protein